MMKQDMLRLSRKLFILLGLLTLCLGFADSIGVKEAHALPCCSTCEQNPSAPLCRFGCADC
jgi:hypothetical protein